MKIQNLLQRKPNIYLDALLKALTLASSLSFDNIFVEGNSALVISLVR